MLLTHVHTPRSTRAGARERFITYSTRAVPNALPAPSVPARPYLYGRMRWWRQCLTRCPQRAYAWRTRASTRERFVAYSTRASA
eukprot:2372907-Alexandrium_andersonii.AAC.1